MSKYLWLIRHGESQGNLEGRIQGWADYPLTDRGRWQAARLAERLAHWTASRWGEGGICTLVTSPLTRALDTAHIIGQALELPVRLEPRLREYDFGPLTSLTPEEIMSNFPVVRESWAVNRPWQPLPGEEGEAAFIVRVRTAMDEIVAEMPEEATWGVVAHGGSLDACLRAWLKIDGYQGRRIFAFDNTSLSLVRIQAGAHRIYLLNDTSHLQPIQDG
jgi:broad specificity phosphatase PhoE